MGKIVRLSLYRLLRASASLCLAATFLMSSASAQQGGTTRYVYDDNGRLRAVVSPTGEAAVYDYDPAGNFTAIRRLAANALELLDFFPKSGVPGDTVTFVGVGFGAGVNSVSFNGTAAQVVSTDATTVVAIVPQGATTGLVTIDTPRGTVPTPVPFTVRGIRVSPATARVIPGQTLQFMAVVVVPGGDQSVRWSVNGVDGGNATVGTITQSGLYAAPNTPTATFSIRATSNAVPSLFGQALVTVQRLEDIRASVSAGVSVKRASPATIPAISAGVSVKRASPSTVPAISPGVAVTRGPRIDSVSPNQLTRGASVTLTINGSNLGGATAISFLDNNSVFDSSITATNINVSPDGMMLTATVMVSAGSALGPRVVIVTSPNGHSLTVDLSVNRVEVVP